MGIPIKVLKLLKGDNCRPYSIYLTNILLNISQLLILVRHNVVVVCYY